MFRYLNIAIAQSIKRKHFFLFHHSWLFDFSFLSEIQNYCFYLLEHLIQILHGHFSFSLIYKPFFLFFASSCATSAASVSCLNRKLNAPSLPPMPLLAFISCANYSTSISIFIYLFLGIFYFTHIDTVF